MKSRQIFIAAIVTLFAMASSAQTRVIVKGPGTRQLAEYTNQVNPWYLGYSCSPDYYIEFCNIFVRFDDIFVTKPPSYAHEMMHCFGAHDLYYANEFIPQEYVEYLMNTYSNDIMYTVADSKDIPNDFTALDAYYVGILDDCEEVSQWGLARSEHENDIPITQED